MGVLEVLLQSSSSVSLLGALVVLLLICLVSTFIFSSQEKGKDPPGPRPLPLLGNLLQLDLKRPYNTLLEFSKTYGSVFTIYMGLKKVVVLAGYRTVKEALVNYAEERFALTNLRDFGMGKKACEDKIIEECDYLIKVFKKSKGEAIDTTQPVNYAVSNIICSIVYGSRFEYNDSEFTSLVDRTNTNIQLGGSPSILESGITNSHFKNENLMATVLNLFTAGTDTTATTLRWALLLMAKYPRIQDQVQQEISSVIGSRQVQVQDRKNLPFTDAVIHETQRVANIVPMALPHKTSQDVTFQGYFIKKGTTVYPLLTSVLYDENEWERPYSFHPAHFLDKDGKFMKREAFMPFSAGPSLLILLLLCFGSSFCFTCQDDRKEAPGPDLSFSLVTCCRKEAPGPRPLLQPGNLLQEGGSRPQTSPSACSVFLLGTLLRKDPPGPRPLPLLGNLLQMDMRTPYKSFMKVSTSSFRLTFSKTYGSVFTIYMGPKKVVVLAGYRTVKGAHVNHAEEFGERDAMLIMQETSSPVSLLGTLLILLLLYFVWTFSFSSQDDRKEPPGPRPLPLLGNLLQLDHKTPYKTLLKFAKKYGSVFTIYMGLKKVVVLAGYRTVKEALVNYAEEFGDRDETRIMHESNQGHGVIWSNGDSWREMKRFALTNLKDFGMGKKACEDKIIEECKYLTEVFRKSKGKTVETAQPINCAVSNIICSIIYGSRYEYDDPEFTALVKRVSRHLELVFSPSMQMYNLFPRVFRWIADRKEFHNIDSLIKKHNLELFRRLDETLNPQMCRGFVDAFLVQKKKLEESGVANSHFHNENLLKSVTNLFSAGTETTATTLKMGLLLMAKNPNIQAQVQEELSSVVGSRQVQVEDRKNLPFTNAVIHETQRVTKIAPQGIPHRTSKDVTFQGHFIRKGTTVYPLISSVLLDETEWERPHSFHPAHFLDKDGKFVKRDAFIPFSAGRRLCPGESLARMELFIFFTTLLQHFHVSLPPGISVDELDQANLCLILDPLPQKL
ncbi:hypothetical protein INR49_008197 [Caranx melampygus]|nr:hypothetical protein INR49_008197 [Caranx melampygus]